MIGVPLPSRPSGYAAHPNYRVDLLRRPDHVEARIGALRLASSERAIIVDEQDHAPVVYFPPEDVDMTALVAFADRSTHCPFKGDAEYWALIEAPDEPVAWSYPAPYIEVAPIANHIAFEKDKVEVLVGVEPTRTR